MIHRENALLSQEDIKFLFDLYRNSPNIVEEEDRTVDRHIASTVGHFVISSFTDEEVRPVWEKILDRLSTSLGSKLDLVAVRILRYSKTCFIPSHVDTDGDHTDILNSVSLIAQLNDSSEYFGGNMIVSNTIIRLNVGDAVMYTYDHFHEVKPVKSGVRYVLNLRFNLVK